MIVGGESGPGARPMERAWVDRIRESADEEIPFFFKQWGGVRKWKTGRALDGRTYSEHPPIVREPMPNTQTRRDAGGIAT